MSRNAPLRTSMGECILSNRPCNRNLNLPSDAHILAVITHPLSRPAVLYIASRIGRNFILMDTAPSIFHRLRDWSAGVGQDIFIHGTLFRDEYNLIQANSFHIVFHIGQRNNNN